MTEEQLHKWVERGFLTRRCIIPAFWQMQQRSIWSTPIVESSLDVDTQNQEQANKQVYILYEEIPDCMGSGSTSRGSGPKQPVFPQALEMLKKGTGNTLVKRTRINGALVETYWKEFSRQFE